MSSPTNPICSATTSAPIDPRPPLPSRAQTVLNSPRNRPMRIPGTMEERANAFTHGLGLGAAFAASSLLLTTAHRNGNAWNLWGCWIYVVTLIAAYAASTFSHVFESPKLRHAFRAADQAIIFLFIAGSWTPIAFAWLRGSPWWWLLHGAMWAVGIGGGLSQCFFLPPPLLRALPPPPLPFSG